MLHWPGGLKEDAETVTNSSHDASGTQLKLQFGLAPASVVVGLQKDLPLTKTLT
jgi:hypothetical protein